MRGPVALHRQADCAEKLPIYAEHGVRNVWLVNPIQRMLEVLRLHEGKWLTRRREPRGLPAMIPTFEIETFTSAG